MVDTSKIHALIAKARRRLRLQAALETGTTASILAIAGALGVIYAVRQGAVTQDVGLTLLIGCLAVVAGGVLLGWLSRFPIHIVATRIDRASNLSDRLSSACYFEGRLAEADDAETKAFMQAAIRDAVDAAPRANIPAATPFRKPRDSRAALAFAVVALLVAGLYFPQGSIAGPATGPDTATLNEDVQPKQTDEFAEEDLDYARDLLDDLHRVAKKPQ